MVNQEFVIKGTVPEIIKILQNDFDMPYEVAKFFAYVMLDRASGEIANAVDKEELAAWYLTGASDKYEWQIFNTHLVINFTTIKKNLCHTAYTFFVSFFSQKELI